MLANPMNIPPISIAAARAALIEQFGSATLRRRATMLWGTRGVGKSSVVRQVAAHFGVPLVDLRLTTIEPVDLRGAIYADEVLAKTVWFPPEFLPTADQPQGILFLDELTAADQRLQISAYSLILDRKVGNYRLPDGWQIVAAGIEHPGACHLLRVACATHMLENGADIRFIQALLGHAKLNTTQIYTHVSIDKLQEIHAATHPARLQRRQDAPAAGEGASAGRELETLLDALDQEDRDDAENGC